MTDITELAQRARINAECGEHLSPAETIEMVEALEKAQQLATQQGNIACALFDEVTAQRQHIAELESRTVRLPAACADDEYFNDGVFQPMRYERDVERALRAAGIKREAE